MEVDLFSLYMRVLDDELQYVEDCEERVEHMQMQATKELIDKYSISGLKTANSLNFDRVALRRAYLFLYSTCHSHMVLFALHRFRLASGCLQLIRLMVDARSTRGSFNFTSIGGGPGSDPVGFLTFLNRSGLSELCPPIHVTVVDAYYQWMGPFKNLMSYFSRSNLQKSDFLVQNLLYPLRPEVTWNLRETHFLSMLKFLSAIAGNEEGTRQTLSTIFELLPVGAMVLVIDNSGGKAFKQAQSTALEYGLRPVYGPACHIKFQVDKTLEPRMMEQRFGFRAQTNCSISIMLLQKQAFQQMRVFHGPQSNLNSFVHRTIPRIAHMARGPFHPYGRPPMTVNNIHPRITPNWTPRQPLFNREISHPSLLPSSYALAQNVCHSFGGVSNTIEHYPWF